ncbi:MAG: hypothetical protein J6U75_00105, partial [Clostridia bacterium]|nr:hypothetical protein [Clostridia bacterium]
MTNGESIVRKTTSGREFANGIKERLLPTICVFFERKESRSSSSLHGRPFFCLFSYCLKISLQQKRGVGVANFF